MIENVCIKFQSRRRERTENGFKTTLIYSGTYEAILQLQNELPPDSVEPGMGQLVSSAMSQETPKIWHLEVLYTTDTEGELSVRPKKKPGEKEHTLSGSMLSLPLESANDYRTNWNHYLFAAATAPSGEPDFFWTATGYSGIFAVSLVTKNNSASLTISAGRCYVNGEPVEVEEVSGVTPSTGWLLLALTRSRSGDGAEFTAEYLIEDEIPPMPTATEDDPDPVLKYPVARIDGSGGNWTIAQTHFYNPPFLTIYGDCETWTTPSGEMGT